MKSKYTRLLRPVAWITFLFPFCVGLGLGIDIDTDLIQVVFAFVSFVCWMSFCFIVNAIGDKEVDKFHDGRSKDMNLANQPIVTGEVNVKEATLLGIFFLIISLFFAWIIDIIFFAIMIIVNIFGYVYSMPPTRFKARPFGDVLANALSGGLIFAAGLSLRNSNVNLLIIIEAILMASIFYLPTVLTDLEFDRKVGLRTSAIFFGPKKILKIIYFFMILLMILGSIIYISSNIELKILVILMVIYSLIFIIATKVNLKGEKLNLHENWILIPFLILSIAFIIYGILKNIGWIVIN